MISQWVRTWYGKAVDPTLKWIARLGITANMLTVVSLLVIVLAAILLARGNAMLGACILMVGGFLDGIDGALARVSGEKSSFGAFLDSICDHVGDFAVYVGLLLSPTRSGSNSEIILIFIAMFASVFGSHVRSRARMVAIETRTVGLFTRFERIFLLFICLLIGRVTLALWGLAVFNSLSALQRVAYTIQTYQRNAYGTRNQTTTFRRIQ
jgi:phosphatidylglycerophosphate synthase